MQLNPDVWAAPLPDPCAPGPAHVVHGPDRITRNSYTLQGELKTVEQAVGTALQQTYAAYSYSPNGKPLSVTDANGNRAEMVYDGLDRQQRWIFPSKTTPGVAEPADYEEYGYDPNANRTSLRKRDGSVIAYQYDALNRMTVKIVPERAGLAAAQTRDVHYDYDLRGLQTKARFDSLAGEGVSNAWDGFGRLVSSSSDLGGTARTVGNQYDANGNRVRVIHPDGSYFTYEMDGLDRPMVIRENGGAPIAQFAYDNAGRRISSGWAATTSYAYDPAGRLQTLSHNLVGDSRDHILGFTYNPASQICSRSSDNDAYAWRPTENVARAYAVNGLNQYTAAGPATFTHDPNGNLAATAHPGVASTAYVYDVENRLVSASGSHNATLTYDPLGRLWQVSSGASVRRLVYDGDALVAEYDTAGNMPHRYIHGNDAGDDPLIWYDNLASGWRRALMTDHQGSVIQVADMYGQPIATNSYDPWGIPALTNAGRFGYTGQTWVPELGLWYYKARFYSPTTGRFLQVDPVGYKDQMNLYAYVGNDPANGTDSTGTSCESVGADGSRAPRCKIDGVAIVDRQGRVIGSRPASPEEERKFAAYNAKYSQTYNRLLSRGDREVTIRGFGRKSREGSFGTSAAKMAEALRTRQVLYAPDRAPRGAAMATSGGPGEGKAPTTYVFDFSLKNPARGDIAHEVGLHGTPEEMSGGLQTPDRPLARRLQVEHQEPYQDAGCAALGRDHCD